MAVACTALWKLSSIIILNVYIFKGSMAVAKGTTTQDYSCCWGRDHSLKAIEDYIHKTVSSNMRNN